MAVGKATLWLAIIADLGAMLVVTAVSLTLMSFGPKLETSKDERIGQVSGLVRNAQVDRETTLSCNQTRDEGL